MGSGVQGVPPGLQEQPISSGIAGVPAGLIAEQISGSRTSDSVAQPSAGHRFWAGVKAGTGGENALNTPVDPQHPIATNPMIPGTGVYRDIKAGNYAGAAGRVVGPAAELLPFALGGRGEEPPPVRVPLWKSAGIEAGPPPSSIDATPMTPQPIHTPGAPVQPTIPIGPRIPLWQRAGVPAEAPPRTIAAPPASAPIATRPNLPAPFATEDQAWRRFAQPGTKQDLAETGEIQDNVRNQADAEHRGMLTRGTEEGFAKNTRPRTSKGDLGKQFQSGKPSAAGSGKGSPAEDLNSADNLQDLLRRSLEIAKKK
jgi:hypothetical protein